MSRRTRSPRALVTGLAALGLVIPTVAAQPAAASMAATVTARPAVLPSQTDACEDGVTRFVSARSAALDLLSADRVWSRATGAGVTVAVVDSGVSSANAHFPAGSVLEGRTFVEEGVATEDKDGHGTTVASIIAAREVPGKSGMIGLARDATILPVQVIEGNDEDAERLPRIVEGIRWAADNGARVINLSVSLTADPPALKDAIAYAVSKDIVVVASAGNRATASESSDGLRYPAAYDGVVGVTASNSLGAVTDDNIHGPQVSVAAPGDKFTFANKAWGDCTFAAAPASSYATAFVSGAAAVLRQAFPQESAAQIIHRLEVTAMRPQRDVRDDTYGWGVIQPYEALTWEYDVSIGGPPAPGAAPRATISPSPQILDLSPVADPNAVDRQLTMWLILLTGTAILALAMWGMMRRARRERKNGVDG